jgi:hypothetical protein
MRIATISIATCTLVGCATQAAMPDPLRASDDALAVEMNTAADVRVLDNDTGLDVMPVLELAAPAAHGTATLGDDGVLHYMPAADYLGDDAVDYTIANGDGETATAHVAISIGCASCAIGGTVTLAWDPSPAGEVISGFRTYMGTSDDAAQMKQIDDIAVDKPGFDPAMPKVTYDAWNDLHLHVGDMVCFALTAYNTAGESGFSVPACTTVKKTAMLIGV